MLCYKAKAYATTGIAGRLFTQKSYTYKLKVYDKAGNSKESSEFLVEPGDTVAPTVAKLEVSNITETGFTLTATGEDDKGIAKYEFYIKNSDGTFTLEKTVETSNTTATYNVTGKTPKTNLYEYKVIVYDVAENSKESDVISIGIKKLSEGVQIGDYVNYDAGVWTTDDLTKITSSTGSPKLHSTVNDTTSDNQALPTTQGQFGGFELGQSRNTNSTSYNDNYKPKTEGWRVWDIDDTTGVVTLISAGHPESYFHGYTTPNGYSSQTVNILTNRNCTMYVNDYATEAHILKGNELSSWYNARYGTNYTLTNGGKDATIMNETFPSTEPISVLDIGADYWLATTYNWGYMYRVTSTENSSKVYYGYYGGAGMGIRILITLKSDILLDPTSGDGSVNNPWKLTQM